MKDLTPGSFPARKGELKPANVRRFALPSSLFPPRERGEEGRSLGPLAILFLITFVAVVTHLTYQNLAEFKDDESRVAGIAVAFLEGQMLPLIGISSSVGVNNPPAFVYLMAIPLAIDRDPVFSTAFIGLLAVGAVLLCYRLCEEFFDRRTAQVASLLFATAPWAIVFSRKMQAQDVVPFFVLLWVGSLFQLARGRPAYHLLGVALWLSVLVQLHFASIALIPLTALALAYIWLRLRPLDSSTLRWAAAAVGLTAVLWIPYLIFQITHGFVDLHALKKVLSQPSTTELASFQYVWDMTASNAFNGWTGIGYDLYHAQTLSFDWLYLVERLLFAASVVVIAGHLARTRGRAPGDWRFVFLLLWLVIPPLVFLRHSSPLFPHYFLIVFPAQFIAMGYLFSVVERWLVGHWPTARLACLPVGGVLVIAFAGTQLYGFLTVMDFIGRAPTLGGHGVPLLQREMAIDRAVVLAAGSTKPVYVSSSGHDYPSALMYLANHRVTLKIFDDRDTFVAPADDGKPTLYLTTNPDQPAVELLHEHFGDRLLETVPFPGMTAGFSFYRLDSNAGEQLLHNADELRVLPATLPNGVQLLGYELDPSVKAGGTVTLEMYWKVAALPPDGEDYSFFTHLVDENNHVWGHLDDLGYPPYFWKLGDFVVSRFSIDVDPQATAGPARIEFGMYRRSDIGRLPIQTADGHSADHVFLGPLKLLPSTTTTVTAPSHPQVAHFGPAIDLIGFDYSAPAKPGTPLHVTLSWQARQTPDTDYTTFVHLLDPTGKIVAQSDGRPGLYPTSLWSAGDVTRDDRVLALPAGLPAGNYTVEVGLYRGDTGARLLTDSGDHVNLGSPVSVAGP
jgi:4-amino-4-deoxy-L-arabinose transferase-like glycosyltransferase